MPKCLKQSYPVLNRSVSASDVLFHHWPFHGSTSVVGFYVTGFRVDFCAFLTFVSMLMIYGSVTVAE